MRLAFKVSVTAFAILAALLCLDATLSVQREESLFRSDIRHDGLLVGRALAGLVSEAWHSAGETRALELIDEADQADDEIRIRWVWLDRREQGAFTPAFAQPLATDPGYGETATLLLRTEDDGTRRAYTYVAVATGDPHPGGLEISESMAAADAYTRATLLRHGILFTTMTLAGGLALLIASNRLVGLPLQRIVHKTELIGAGDLSHPLPTRSHDELGRLAGAINAMCSQLEEARRAMRAETEAKITAMERLRQAERLATVGKLSAGLAHELGTPLNVVSGWAKRIYGGRLSGRDAAEHAGIILRQAERMTNIIQGLLDFARHRPLRQVVADLNTLVSGVISALEHEADNAGVQVRFTAFAGLPPGWIDPDQIEQVLMNLVVNALQATAAGGGVRIGLDERETVPPMHVAHACAGTYLSIQVSDTGTGIPSETLPHIFEPFFTTKDIGRGTGLGLAVAYGIVREHGGWIEVESRLGRGSEFTVYLPPAAPTADMQRVAISQEPPPLHPNSTTL